MRDRPAACLVSMPWATVTRPQLAVGTLAAALRARDIDCCVLHPTLDFALRIGAERYETLARERSMFAACEHVFAAQAFGAASLESDEFLSRFTLAMESDPQERNLFRFLRDSVVPEFVQQTGRTIRRLAPRVVGFSCTFNQAMASLAVARRLKETAPELIVVFGGASMHGEMGRSFADAFPDWIDFVFTGEADLDFPQFIERVLRGEPVSDLPGIAHGSAGGPDCARVDNLDELPVPDFGDFFTQRDDLIRDGGRLPPIADLPYESSRGCWWGQKSHCSFCGMNGSGMTFRTKSSGRVVNELMALARRHGITSFCAADNILPAGAYRDLLPRLATLGVDLRLFYEMKANVRRDDIAALAEAGVKWVQPGIESFSDHVLNLMRKGACVMHNVQMLKWAKEFGIQPDYNILVGMPGETALDYDEMLDVICRIAHLPPPSARALPLQIHRFSPFFESPEAFGMRDLRPSSAYRHLIPPAVLPAERFAYFFERNTGHEAELAGHVDRLNAAIDAWSLSPATREARLGPGFVTVVSGAAGRETGNVPLDAAASLILILADRQIGTERLLGQCQAVLPDESAGALHERIDWLVERGWLLRVPKRVLSLLPLARPRRSAELENWVSRWFGVEMKAETDAPTAPAAANC